MEYKGRLFAKIGNKYVSISHSDEFDKLYFEFNECIKNIECQNKIISDLENDIDEKEDALNDIRVHTENIFTITDDTNVMIYANRIMHTLDNLDKIS